MVKVWLPTIAIPILPEDIFISPVGCYLWHHWVAIANLTSEQAKRKQKGMAIWNLYIIEQI